MSTHSCNPFLSTRLISSRVRIGSICICFLLTAFAAHAAPADILVDSFDLTNTRADFNSGFVGPISAPGFGGGRDGVGAAFDGTDINVTAPGALWQTSIGFGGAQLTFVAYDGFNNGSEGSAFSFPDTGAIGLGGGGGMNLSNFDGFNLDVLTMTGPAFSWQVAVKDATGSAESSPYALTLGPVNQILFTDPAFAGIDFSTVEQIRFALIDNGAAGSTLTLNSFSIAGVPEPSTALLGMMGLTGILVTHRRRRIDCQ